jgi:hypothetical protein
VNDLFDEIEMYVNTLPPLDSDCLPDPVPYGCCVRGCTREVDFVIGFNRVCSYHNTYYYSLHFFDDGTALDPNDLSGDNDG